MATTTADNIQIIGGVDTHQDLHTAAVVSHDGTVLEYRIVLHHPSRLPGDASLVPLSWRAASCRSGIHRYLRSRHHPAPGTLGYPRARGDRAGPSQPKLPRARTTPWMRSPRPRRRAQDAGSRWPKTVPAAWKPCRDAANNAKDGNQVPPRGPAATPQHHRCRTGGSA